MNLLFADDHVLHSNLYHSETCIYMDN